MMICECIYCQKVISENHDCDESLVSHGICFTCLTNELAKYGQSMETFLNTFSEPIFIIGGKDDIWGANQAARQRVNSDILNISEHQDIRIFGCLNDSNREICQAEVQCLNCAIRSAVKATFSSDDFRVRIPACHDIRSLDGHRNIEFYVSTKKIGTSVFLHIEQLQPVDLAV